MVNYTPPGIHKPTHTLLSSSGQLIMIRLTSFFVSFVLTLKNGGNLEEYIWEGIEVYDLFDKPT